MAELQSLNAAIERIASLPLRIDSLAVDVLSRPSLAGGTRRTSVVSMRGLDVEGPGEDVTFQADDLLRAPPPRRAWAGISTLGDFWEQLSFADLVAAPLRPVRFVVSPPQRESHRFPTARLKLDAAEIEPGHAVDVVDFKLSGPSARRKGSPSTQAASTSSGPGRRQIQLLASLFHPDAPNDVALAGYNDAVVRAARRTLASGRSTTSRAARGGTWR